MMVHDFQLFWVCVHALNLVTVASMAVAPEHVGQYLDVFDRFANSHGISLAIVVAVLILFLVKDYRRELSIKTERRELIAQHVALEKWVRDELTKRVTDSSVADAALTAAVNTNTIAVNEMADVLRASGLPLQRHNDNAG